MIIVGCGSPTDCGTSSGRAPDCRSCADRNVRATQRPFLRKVHWNSPTRVGVYLSQPCDRPGEDSMGMSVGGGKGPSATINVTPMIDVLLVLLIIFMIITPFSMGEKALIPQ